MLRSDGRRTSPLGPGHKVFDCFLGNQQYLPLCKDAQNGRGFGGWLTPLPSMREKKYSLRAPMRFCHPAYCRRIWTRSLPIGIRRAALSKLPENLMKPLRRSTSSFASFITSPILAPVAYSVRRAARRVLWCNVSFVVLQDGADRNRVRIFFLCIDVGQEG